MPKSKENLLTQGNPANSYQVITKGIASMGAGVVVSYSTFPLEATKKMLEAGNLTNKQVVDYVWRTKMTTPQLFADSWKKGYLQFLYRGSFAFALNVVPTTTIQFTFNEKLKAWLPDDGSHIKNISRNALAGMFGATTAVIVENTVVRQQILNKALWPTLRHDLFTQSLLRPWKSYPCIATRDSIFAVCMFWGLPEANKYVERNLGTGYLYSIPTWFTVSVLGTLLSHPADMIGTQQQKTHAIKPVSQICKEIYNSHGLKGFYKGAPQRFLLFSTFMGGLPKLEKYFNDRITKRISESQISSAGNNSFKPNK